MTQARMKPSLKRNEGWIQKEGAYALVQSTKPQSLAAGLSDSQVGLAAWLVENFRAWSDCGATSNALLRLLKCKCHDMDEGRNQELGRFMQSSDIVSAFRQTIFKAREFYGKTLGLELSSGPEGTLVVPLSGGTKARMYPKPISSTDKIFPGWILEPRDRRTVPREILSRAEFSFQVVAVL